MNLRPLLDALDLQEDAARTLANELRAQIDDLQTRLREAESHLEHLTITRKTVTGLADRLPNVAPEPPEHPDYPRILAAFNHATGKLGLLWLVEWVGMRTEPGADCECRGHGPRGLRCLFSVPPQRWFGTGRGCGCPVI